MGSVAGERRQACDVRSWRLTLDGPAEHGSNARCAIYTRKSHDERADSQFGSIEAQRELCERYVASQAGEGWTLLPDRFDDEGFSGGTLKRPALDQLLTAVERGNVDIVVVYKIDRLSRSLRDFLDLVGRFESAGVTFAAITQQFSTTSSMGRLTLNVLLSFAQFEREVTSERLRDWFAGARERGLWTSGAAPFGYSVHELRLIPEPVQAEIVRRVFRRYPVLGSARLVADELNALGCLYKGGRPFTRVQVVRILHNRLYRGEMVHKGGSLPGLHEPLVSEAAFQRARAAMAETGRRRASHRRPPIHGMLKGMLFGPQGETLIHVFVKRRGKTYRYYVPSRTRYGPGNRFRAVDLEAAVTRLVGQLVDPSELHPAASNAVIPADEHIMTGVVRRLVERIDAGRDRLLVRLLTGASITIEHCGLIATSYCDVPAGAR